VKYIRRVVTVWMLISSSGGGLAVTTANGAERQTIGPEIENWIDGLRSERLRSASREEFERLFSRDGRVATEAVDFFSDLQARPVLYSALQRVSGDAVKSQVLRSLLDLSRPRDRELVRTMIQQLRLSVERSVCCGTEAELARKELRHALVSGLQQMTELEFGDADGDTRLGAETVIRQAEEWLGQD
jgi:hypothetical protein